MSTAIELKKKAEGVSTLVNGMIPELAKAIPAGGASAAQFARVALTSIRKNPKILECTEWSLRAALMDAASLGLDVDGLLGEAYLIPQKRGGVQEVRLGIGYKGLVSLARRSGEIKTISADVVYEGDHFVWENGIHPKLEHRKDQPPGARKVTHVWAAAEFKDGGYQIVVMFKEEVDKIRAFSRSGEYGPWKDNYPAMAKKTAIIQLCKLLPLKKNDARAILNEEAEAPTPVFSSTPDGALYDSETGEVVAEPSGLDKLIEDATGVANAEIVK